MAVGDLYFARWNMSVQSVDCGFGVWFQVTTEGPGSDPCGLLAAQLFTESANLLPGLSDEARLESVYVVRVSEENSPPGLTLSANGQGEINAEAADPTVCAILQFLQIADGARHNGRAYIPGITENSTTGNRLSDAATIAALQAFGNAILNIDVLGGAWTWRAVLNGTQGLSEPSPGEPKVRDITEVRVNGTIHGQRRRKSRIFGSHLAVAEPG